MQLNIREVLDFFDNKIESQKGDANALMSIMGEDLNASIYRHFRKNQIDILEESVVQGFKGGKYLDRWMFDRKNKVLIQCEIKNWAATAIGGKKLSPKASNEDTKKVAEHHWKHELETNLSRKAKIPNVAKVLFAMRRPKEYVDISKVEPLLIYWMPITKDKKGLNPLSVLFVSSLNLKIKSQFSKLQIFSASLYLRQLYKNGKGIKFIVVDMPHFEHRMRILNKFKK